jgi:hypothetical protein
VGRNRETLTFVGLEAILKKLETILTAAILGSVLFEVSPVAAENSRKLSGAQIRATFTGMQLTDEVHWRYVYDRGGTLRS